MNTENTQERPEDAARRFAMLHEWLCDGSPTDPWDGLKESERVGYRRDVDALLAVADERDPLRAFCRALVNPVGGTPYAGAAARSTLRHLLEASYDS